MRAYIVTYTVTQHDTGARQVVVEDLAKFVKAHRARTHATPFLNNVVVLDIPRFEFDELSTVYAF